MKKILLTLFLPITLLAQSEFGYHATWYFDYSELGFYGYKKITHVGDTTMLGLDWLKFEVTGVSEIRTGPGPNDISQDTNAVFDPIYVATRNDSVFRLWDTDSLYLLYDFNAGIGDKWQFAPHDTSHGCDSLPIATVQNLGTEIIDSQNVNFMDVSFPMDTVNYGGNPNYQVVSNASLSSRIYPEFGSTHYNALFEASPNLCDGSSFQLSNYNLRCFSNDNIAINLTSQACHYWKYIGLDELEAVELKVYPNPTNGLINIEAEYEVEDVEIYSLDGQLLHTAHHSEVIELPQPTGIYVIKISFKGGLQLVRKVVKEL